MNGCFSQQIYGKFEFVFVLTQNAFLLRFYSKANEKTLGSSEKFLK